MASAFANTVFTYRLNDIYHIFTKLPPDIAQEIVHEIKHQPNPATQASTIQPAPVHTGLNPTVNPSSLTSNNRAGQGNNGG
ncbi:hypothetical protein FGRA07_11418 [Fusarium graminearum]|nr:hypothetical protein FGRA07_11418 [Fusarium graminearum]